MKNLKNKPKLIASYRCCSDYLQGYNPYKFINRMLFYRCCMRDTWEWLNQFSEFDYYNVSEKPSEKDLKTPINFNDEIENRANYIINLANKQNKKIIISYSGGVDSTSVACAILKNRLDHQKIIILHTKESIDENPQFYEFLHKFKNVYFDLKTHETLYSHLKNKSDYILTNGWCADQLFHFGIVKYAGADYFHQHWNYGMLKLFQVLHHGNIKEYNKYSDAIEQIEEYLKTVLDYPITQFGEFAWFWNHTCKRGYIKNVCNLESESEYYSNNNIPFFDTPNFNTWSVQNYRDILNQNFWEEDAFSYKIPLKDYIFNFTNNKDYYKLNKVRSYHPRLIVMQKNLKFGVVDTSGSIRQIPIKTQKDKYEYLLEHYGKF